MAEIEKMTAAVDQPDPAPVSAADPVPVPETVKPTTSVAPPTDIPVTATDTVSSETPELGTSPTQEPSSNSHPHDSEYDTASDLEGGEEYDDDDDDDEDDDGESGSEDDTETDEETEEDEDGAGEMPDGDTSSAAAAAAAAQKKVDEDRSNPQYIPKRGTFYEHDDRTAETEVNIVIEDDSQSQSLTEINGDANSVGGGAAQSAAGEGASGASVGGQAPTISQASKTMKKWQPASGGDRWSHDRFEANEQAPKSRAELLQTYGYDIRNEDAAPRARRRRRYGRGPSKYSRNWEDEQAYLKASNKERKPPRPQDFPALNERKVSRRPLAASGRAEKENRRGGVGAGAPGGSQEQPRHYGRHSNGSSAGRQNAMEFKQKSNRGPHPQPRERERERDRVDRDQPVEQHTKPTTPRANGQTIQNNEGLQVQPNTNQQHQQQTQTQQRQQPIQQQQQHQPQQQLPLPTPPTQNQIPPLSTTNLSQRLQQVQQRNDPSHVGSVQMQALATQNQQQQQQQQQVHMQQQSQSVAPKRYSSLRRSQQQQDQIQQQIQMQQQQQQQQQQSQIILQDPHMLMQIAYQQQELQAQLQGLQLGPAPGPASVPPPAAKQPAQPPAAAAYAPAQGAPYYVTGAEAGPYGNPAAAAAAAAAYLPTTPAAVAYAQAQAQSAPAQPQAPPQAQVAATQSAQAPPPSMNYHQNYNTVGGTTYFVPPAQTTNRPTQLPQRRPTNAIPILPPSEKHKSRGAASGAGSGGGQPKEEGGNSDNIDHILDNMFVQRPAFQAPADSAATSSKEDTTTTSINNAATSNSSTSSGAIPEQNLQPVPVTGQE